MYFVYTKFPLTNNNYKVLSFDILPMRATTFKKYGGCRL